MEQNGLSKTLKRIFIKIKDNMLSYGMCIKEYGMIFFIQQKYFFYKKDYRKYISLIYEKLLNEVLEIVEKYKEVGLRDAYVTLHVETEKPMVKNVFVCWWQGYDNMPDLCKMCFERLEALLNQEKFKLILITKENYSEFAYIPGYIIEKMEKGMISITLFSDILRQALISQNGGFWADSTIWFEPGVNDFFSMCTDFWSVKLEAIDDPAIWGQLISECKWSGFIMGGKRKNIISSFVFDAMCEYFHKHNYLIDYFIQNLLIKIAYQEIPEVREAIDNIECSNPHMYELFRNIDHEFSERLWMRISDNTAMFKLTYKHEYLESVHGKDTMYKFLKER